MVDFLQLPTAYALSWQSWLLVLLTGFVVGLSKAGLKGITILVVTILALTFGSKPSTGILLVLLIFGDILAIAYYHRHVRWEYLLLLLPPMILGVIIGVLVGDSIPDSVFKKSMAVLIFATVIMMLWWDWKKPKHVVFGRWFANTMGFGAGFATMIGNLAGAFSNIYFLAMQLPKQQFIGTAAWLFFIINLFKLPFHVWVWETVHLTSFSLNLRLFPAVLIGFLVGVRIIQRVKDDLYRKLILGATALGSLLIFLR